MIRAVIIDDEQPAADKMEKMLKESGIVDIKGVYTYATAALEGIKNTEVDVVFLDIEMPDINGMALSKNITEIDENIAIIFTTAYSQYAVDAFRLDAMDYLMKPLEKELLKETLDRIIQKKNIKVGTYSNRIHCFGKFKAANDRGIVRFRTAKAEELMAFFVDQHGREVSRNEIVDQIWSDFDGDKAIDNFNTTLYYMKKALSSNGFEIVVERNRDRYKVNLDSAYCDYLEFKSFIGSEKKITDNTIVRWERIIRLYKGEYLEGNEFSWAERNKLLLKEKYIHLVLKAADYYKDLQQYNKAIELLRTGLRHEPLHEALNTELIKNYMLMGNGYSAVKQYNLYKKRLRKELGIEPNVKIKKIIKKVRK